MLIVYVDSPANFDAVKTLATDNTATGTTAGEEMLKELEVKGITRGSIGIVNVNAATASGVGFDQSDTIMGSSRAAACWPPWPRTPT